MEKVFQYFAKNKKEFDMPIELFNRLIPIQKQAGETAWFNFLDLSGIPRSTKDFLALLQKYKTILVSNVTIIRADQKNLITSFINNIIY
ncbi:AFG1/ZapE family ATPase [Candidatus Coxiella mudrowiae]|uniref:AFG1/ZapE family ATPase n=1 Tax=Candidatus Coxiella mudrowiae TaxID=2054173 RepID=UPI00138E3AF8|nr:AFG1/ZapE family ATPase [Candidatus Coxiella mudrowiae]